MSLKVEIIKAIGDNPSFLVINDLETYPVKDISFRGRDNKTQENITKSFSFDTGLLFFVDIFDQPHYYVNYNNESKAKSKIFDSFWF